MLQAWLAGLRQLGWEGSAWGLLMLCISQAHAPSFGLDTRAGPDGPGLLEPSVWGQTCQRETAITSGDGHNLSDSLLGGQWGVGAR